MNERIPVGKCLLGNCFLGYETNEGIFDAGNFAYQFTTCRFFELISFELTIYDEYSSMRPHVSM